MLGLSMGALWVGRVWTGAYDYWHQRGLVARERLWEGHRVCILGRGNGKGGGIVVARTVLCQVLKAGGGQIVKEGENETFAIVESGVPKEDAASLLRRGVLCLGVGFVIEVVVRGRGHPGEYLLFEEQRALCGSKIELGEGRVKVTKAQFKQACLTKVENQASGNGEHEHCADGNVRPPNQSCLVRLQIRAPTEGERKTSVGRNIRNRNQYQTCMLTLRLKPNLLMDKSEPHLVKGNSRMQGNLDSPLSVEALEEERELPPEVVVVGETLVTKPNCRSSSPLSKKVIDLTDKLVSLSTPATHVKTVTPKRKCSSQEGIRSSGSEDFGSKRQRKRKRTRLCRDDVTSQLQFDSPKKIDLEALDVDEEPTSFRVPTDKASTPLPKSDLPCEESGDDYKERDALFTQSPGFRRTRSQQRRAASCSVSVSTAQKQCESGMGVTIHSLPVPDVDNASEFSRFAAPCGISPLLQSKRIFTIEDGFSFVVEVLGGRPSDRDVANLLLPQGNERTHHESSVSDVENELSEKRQESHPGMTQMNAEEDSPQFSEDELEPTCEDANAMCFELATLEDGLQEQSITKGRRKRGIQSQTTSARVGKVTQPRGSLDLFELPAPKQPILLEQVIPSEITTLHHSDDVSIVHANVTDDDACQDEVQFVEWILGAERLVGSSSSWLAHQETGRMDATAMRISLALVESGAICQFGTQGSHNNSEFTVLIGICVRLLTAPTAYDPGLTIITELLSLRDKQIQAGFDSLQLVFSSNKLSTVPRRHRLIAAIWSILAHQGARSTDRDDLWTIFNKACAARMIKALSKSAVTLTTYQEALMNVLQWILSATVAAGRSFALYIDFMSDSKRVCESKQNQLCPENWNIVRQCLEHFYDDKASLAGQGSGSEEILHSFLSKVAVHVAGRLWDVTDEILTAISKAISFLSKANDENCYCKSPPLFVAQFHGLSDINSGRPGLKEHLQTPCDCYFFLGWLFCTYGAGNAMKRALSVIKNASLFTNVKVSSSYYSRAVNHHVGLTLTVADSLASANQNGEYLLCRTLTSKCASLETIVDRIIDHGKKYDICWRTTVEAIAVRCRVLIARGQSVHCYCNWLFQSIIGAFRMTLKGAGRRISTILEREERRVQESIFGNLALLALKTLREITDSVHSKALEGGEESRKMNEHFGKESESYISGFSKYGNDIMSQMRINGGEGAHKGKGELLNVMMAVITNELKLLRLMNCKRQEGEGDWMKIHCKTQLALDGNLEKLMMTVIASDILKEDPELATKMKQTAARGLAELLELVHVQSGSYFGENEKRRITGLVKLTFHGNAVAQRLQSWKCEFIEQEMKRREMQSKVEVEFWSTALSRNWTCELIETGNDLEAMAVRAIVMGMGYALRVEMDEDYRKAVWKLVKDAGGVKRLERVVHKQQDEVESEGIGSAEAQWLMKSTRTVMDLLTVKQAEMIIESLDVVMVDLISVSLQADTLCNAVLIHADLFLLTFHACRPPCSMKQNHTARLQPWLGPLISAVQKLQVRSWQGRREEIDGIMRAVEQRVISGLGTVAPSSRDLENQVCVMRVVKALAQGETTLDGLWERAVQPRCGIEGEEMKRYERQVVQWQKMAFDVAIDEPLCRIEFNRSFVELRHLMERFLAAVLLFSRSTPSGQREALVWQAKQSYRRACQGRVRSQGQVAAPETWAQIEELLSGACR